MRRLVAGFGLAILALAGFLYVFDPVAMYRAVEGLAVLPFAAGLGAVFLAVICWGESMRWVLRAAGVAHRQYLLDEHSGTVGGDAAVWRDRAAGGVPIMALAIDREARIGFNRSTAVVTVVEIGCINTLARGSTGVRGKRTCRHSPVQPAGTARASPLTVAEGGASVTRHTIRCVDPCPARRGPRPARWPG
jgi:hypothetical protein